MKSLDIMLQTSSFRYYSRVYFFCGVGLESPKTTFIWKLPAVIFSTNRQMRKVMIETTLLLFLSNMYLNLFPSSAIFTNSRSTLHFQWKYHLPVFKAFQSRSIFNILLWTTHLLSCLHLEHCPEKAMWYLLFFGHSPKEQPSPNIYSV